MPQSPGMRDTHEARNRFSSISIRRLGSQVQLFEQVVPGKSLKRGESFARWQRGREEHTCARMPYKEPFIHGRRPGERYSRDTGVEAKDRLENTGPNGIAHS